LRVASLLYARSAPIPLFARKRVLKVKPMFG